MDLDSEEVVLTGPARFPVGTLPDCRQRLRDCVRNATQYLQTSVSLFPHIYSELSMMNGAMAVPLRIVNVQRKYRREISKARGWVATEIAYVRHWLSWW